MPSSYTTSLKIQLMADGEDSGTWGDNTNTNWDLIEQATAGVQTITMSNTNYTLSNLNGTIDEARNATLIIQGTNSAVYAVVAPLVPKTYTISNQTTGGYAITIEAPGGIQTVTIPNGVTTQVYCDGVNGFYFASSSSGGDFLVPGNFSAAGTGAILGAVALGSTLAVVGATTLTGTAALNGGGTSTTPATTDSSTNIATTAYVKNNITALNLGTMSTQNATNVAITGGTINSTTIGATTPAAITGTTITGTTITGTTVNGTTFSGAGTGLTGTAAGLSIGGNAATATNATNATNSTNATNIVAGGNIASTVTAATQTAGDNSTKVATTQYVATAVSNATSALGTMSTQNANAVAITGGTITGTYGLSTTGNAATATNATSATTATTASNASAFQGKTKLGLGITGEVWNNVTGSRGSGVQYTNPYTYPIMVSATGSPANSAPSLDIYVGGILVSSFNWQFNGAGARSGGCTIVPAGATYQLNFNGSGIQNWAELY